MQATADTGWMTRLQQRVEGREGGFGGWSRRLKTQLEWRIGGLRPFLGDPRQPVRRLVFVCLGNLNRSAFAAAVARQRGVPAANALSVGIAAREGDGPPAAALRVAAEFGIDLSAHTAAPLVDHEIRPGDLLLVMEAAHARHLVEIGAPPEVIALLGQWHEPPRLHLEDPQLRSDAYYRSCFAALRSATLNMVDRLMPHASDRQAGAATPPQSR